MANLDEDSDWETILKVQSQSQAEAQNLEHDEILSDGMLRQMHALEWKSIGKFSVDRFLFIEYTRKCGWGWSRWFGV